MKSHGKLAIIIQSSYRTPSFVLNMFNLTSECATGSHGSLLMYHFCEGGISYITESNSPILSFEFETFNCLEIQSSSDINKKQKRTTIKTFLSTKH